MTRVQAGGIPAERDALRLAAPDRLADPEVLAHVVENQLGAARAAHPLRERVDVADGALHVLGVMPRLVHQLDEQDGRLVFQGDVRVGIDVPEDLPQVVHLRRERGRVGAHAGLAEMPAESGIGGVSEGVGPIGPIQLNGTEQHVDAALARAGDQVVQQVEMVVGDQVAGRVGSLPVAPEGQPQAVPTHAGELRHVLVDHLLAIGVDVAGGAVIRGGGQHVVRAEEGDFLLRISPPHDALFVEIDATVGDLRLSRRC